MQFGMYLIVGGLAFWVDIGSFVVMQQYGLPVLPSSMASFVLATIANYILSSTIVFQRGRFARAPEIARLFLVAGIGLALNTALVALFIAVLDLAPVIAKVVVVPIVLVWNYLGRRIFVFHAKMPAGVENIWASIRRMMQQRS